MNCVDVYILSVTFCYRFCIDLYWRKTMFWISHVRFILIASTLTLVGCTKDIPEIDCADPDVNSCYVKHSVEALNVVRENINAWSNILLIGQVLVFVFGLISTIMIALQGDANKYWTRPIGLIATALVTGLTSALVSFHVTANMTSWSTYIQI